MKPLAVYIHWPFCASKCPYCDFNSHVADRISYEEWARAYEAEIAHYAALVPGRLVRSIFFGGGTPSLMAPETVQRAIAAVRRHWHLANDAEITLEANPTSVEAEKFAAFAEAGVNRVSIGVQSFDDATLRFLGRGHNAAEAAQALALAAEYFPRYSFDLIYARPGQTLAAWETELDKALSFATGHLSLYQLTIERGTPFFLQEARGDFKLPPDFLAADFYELTQARLKAAGLPSYEVSNHARPGEESRHNLAYWRYEDYVGIGPGAHGRLTLLNGDKVASRGHRAPDIWLENVSKRGQGGHPFETLTRQERVSEALMMGLRLSEGVSTSRLAEEAGEEDWKTIIAPQKISALREEGLLRKANKNEERIIATERGVQTLNAVLGYLL